MKQCACWQQWKDEEEFRWRWKGWGRRQSVCRDCQRLGKDHHEHHTEEVRAKALVTKMRTLEESERFIDDTCSYRTCADGGEYNFAV